MKKMFKKAISLLLTAGMLVGTVTPFSVSAADVDISANLIAHYDFEGTQGTSVPNVCGDTFTGTLSGSNVSLAEEEDWGNVLSFSTSSADGRMTIPDIVNTGANSYSISMWYKLDTSLSRGSKRTVLLQQTDSGRTLLTLTSSNQYHTYVNATDINSNNSVNVNNWQHVIFVYDSDSQQVSFYVNGELDSTQSAGSSEVNAVTDLLIGHHKSSDTDPLAFAGLVDEIRVYEGVITPDVASAIYEENAPEETETPDDTTGLVLSINPEEVERILDDSAIGINHRYGFNGYGTFDSETMTMNEEFVELYEEAGFGSIRYPGGTISNLFQWKSTIGPVEDRVKQIHGFYNNSGQNGLGVSFGLTEIGNFADQVGSEIVYVYGMGRGSAQDAADLIEYLNAPVGSNPNGGVAWAEIRQSNGHTEPYNVRYFELGNETNQGASSGDGTWSQQYWMSFVSGGAEYAYVNGGIAVFTKQYAVLKDNWNQAVSGSDGTANQVRYMRYANPNPMTGEDGKTLVEDFEAVVKGSVHVYVNNTEWTIVDSLENQSATAQVVTVDYRDGSFTFGDGVHGAIPASGASITVSYNVEREGFVDIASAMKDTTAQINAYYEEQNIDKEVECYTYSSYESQGFITKMAAGGYNDLYDGLTIHPYSGTPTETSPEIFYDSAMSLAESAGIGKVQTYVNMLPEGKVPVISEYGIFRSTNTQVRSQTHALYIAKVLMEYVRLGSPYIQKHCLTDWYSSGADSLGPTQQAVIQVVPQAGASTATGEGEFKYFATPSARVFEMMKDYGNDIISSEFSSMDYMTNGVKLYSALASKDEDGTIYVAIVNLNRTNAKDVTIDVDGLDATGTDITIQTLAGDAIDSQNTLEDSDNVDIETSNMVGTSENITVELPAHSFSVIKIESFDKEKLQAKIAEAEDYVEEEYTADSWKAVKEAIEAAKAVYEDEDATQAEIAEVIVALENAAAALVVRVTRAELEAAVEQYEAYELAGYTEASVEAFEGALTAAQSVLANDNASQDDISKALYDLENAAAALAVDKATLEAAIAEAQAKEEDGYSISSWTRLTEALAEATSVYGDKNATAEEVAAAAEALLAAIHSLKAAQPTIPVSAMTVSAGDSQSGEGPDKAIDDDASTVWHTNWYTGPNHDNHWFQIELDQVYTVAGLKYQPRQSGPNGIITEYEIWASLDGEDWTTVASGEWAQDASWKEAEIDNVEAKYIRLVTISAGSDQSIMFASAAEIRLTGVVACAEHNIELTGKLDATCTEDGYTGDEVCTLCGTVVTKGEVIKATGHTLGEFKVVKDATCTEAGSKEAVCETCGEKETEEIAALGHVWGDWTVVKDATTEEEGLEERVCTVCGEKEDRTIEKLPEEKPENPFVDIAENDWYYNAVLWGTEKQIVAGWTKDQFAPALNCTRAQIVAFLWRAAGRPEAESTECPFTDVDAGEYYYKAMLWAVEEGIAKGYTEDKFAPEETCTRAEMATFLWRVGGYKEAENENPFVDIEESNWYYKAVLWAAENKVVSGYGDGTEFAPNNTITRAETVTMLYRFYK